MTKIQKNALVILLILSINYLTGCQQLIGFQQGLFSQNKSNHIDEEKNINNQQFIPGIKDEESEKIDEELEDSIVKLIFVGDTMMDSTVAMVMDEKGNDYPLSEFMPILKDADLIIANLETSIGTSRDLMEKSYAFQTDPLRFSLFDPIKEKVVFSFANNHGMDGPLNETLKHIKNLKYPYVGIGNNVEEAFKPYITTINGVSIAIIGASRVIPIPEWTATANTSGMATAYTHEPLIEMVKECKEKVDYVITYIHWGEERAKEPNEVQLNLEKALKEAGSNLIIGSHPHIVQKINWNTEKQLTAYSLGNFVFTTSINPVSNDTIALEIHLSKNRIEEVQIWPGQIQYGLVRSLYNTEEKDRIYKKVQNLSGGIIIDKEGKINKKNY